MPGVVQARFYIPSDPGQEPIIRPYVDILRKAWIRERKTIQSFLKLRYFRQLSKYKKKICQVEVWQSRKLLNDIKWISEIDVLIQYKLLNDYLFDL